MKKPVVIPAAGVLVVSIVAVLLWSELRTVRAQTAQLRSRVTELQSATALVPVSVPTPGEAAVHVQTAAALPAEVRAPDKTDMKPMIEALMKNLASGEGRELALTMARRMMPTMYPDVGRELGLNDMEVEKFFDLLAKHQAGLAADPSDPAAMQEAQRKIREGQQANQAELSAMLGSKYPQWQEYQKTLTMRRQVNQLQSVLNSGNNSLSYTESKPLIAALAAEQDRIQQDRRNAPPPPGGRRQLTNEEELRRMEEDSKRFVSTASAHLNPQQLDSYRALLEQQQSSVRMMMQTMGDFGE